MKMNKIVCIYKIINKINNKFYIGSTVDFNKRKNEHKRYLKRNRHHSQYLQRSWNKYGEENFNFIILEECNVDILKDKEQFYLDTLTPSYNISKSSKCPMLGRKHSLQTLEKFKMKIGLKGKDNPMFGKKWSKELREKILKKRIGSKRSEETKKKMSETSKKLNRGLDLLESSLKRRKKVIDSNGNIFNSLKECAKFWNIQVSTVCDILHGRHNQTKNKITFKYYE
jgi:group I intron endonuclease